MSTGTIETVGHGEAVHEKPDLLKFDPGIGIWTFIAFGLLLILLKRFAWKPILASIDERDKKIKDALDRAANIQLESENQMAEQRKVLAQAQEQAALLMAEARKNAEAIREQLVEQAQGEKSKIIRSATDEIESMKHQIKTELREFSAELAIGTAERILKDQLDQPKAKTLASRMVQEFQP